MKTAIERLDIDHGDFIILPPKSSKRRTLFPFAMLSAMVCAILLMDAILPLRDLWFHEALLTQLGWWPALPSLILFPGWAVIPPIPQIHATGLPLVIHSWEKVPLLFGAFVIVFLIYLQALRRLPSLVTRRFVLNSTILLGILYALIPIVTSPDVFSYIAYARIGVIHHLNPLTTLPTAIGADPIYTYLSWIDQPSAYGPTWVIITSAWQWIFTSFGIEYILEMMIVLRVQGMVMHLVSTLLIWSISGHFQQVNGNTSSTRRTLATLAFAWNPLLLFEACVNAHSDTTLLTLILLSIWFLTRNAAARSDVRSTPVLGRANIQTRFARFATGSYGSIILAAAMLALATCLKINVILFVPGLLLYTWARGPASDRLKRIVVAGATYTGVFVLLYAPFWQGGAILNVFSVNPATYRSMNSPANFLGHLYNAIAATLGFPIGEPIGSPAERITHTLSMGIFVVIYLLLCWRVIRKPGRISTVQGLMRWMAVVWLAYCAFGSPWFWPWYIVTFFGLYALIEASAGRGNQGISTYFVRLLIFSMLTIYCFTAWGPSNSFVPGLPGFEWAYFSGLFVWGLPLVGAALLVRVRSGRVNNRPLVLTHK
jgi:hypothetical protein